MTETKFFHCLRYVKRIRNEHKRLYGIMYLNCLINETEPQDRKLYKLSAVNAQSVQSAINNIIN